jgi:hypothetical protein
MASTQHKTHKAISDWIGDIVALESHVEEAMDRQLKLKSNSSATTEAIKRFHDAVRASKQRAVEYREQYGSTPGNPIKELGSNLLGKAAGMVDMLREDSASKALRDDFAAYNLLAVSYTMLHTSSMAFADDQTRAFAEEGLRTYAKLVQEINNVLPEALVADLQENQDDHPVVNPKIAAECRRAIDAIWKQTAS